MVRNVLVGLAGSVARDRMIGLRRAPSPNDAARRSGRTRLNAAAIRTHNFMRTPRLWRLIAAAVGVAACDGDRALRSPVSTMRVREVPGPGPMTALIEQHPVTAAVGVPKESDCVVLPKGGRILAVSGGMATGVATVLTTAFAAAGRPDVSFDATRFLFVGRKGESDVDGVWEMDTDGTGGREIVQMPGGCQAAIYLPTLYTLDAERPEPRIAFAGRDARGEPSQLFTCRPDGSDVRQITFAPRGVMDPYLLSDGRLLFASAQDDEEPGHKGNVSLFTVNTDGTDLFPFTGVGGDAVSRRSPSETSDHWLAFIESPIGRGEVDGAVVGVRTTSSLHTRRVIAADRAGRYRSVSPLVDEDAFVSYRPHNGHGATTFGIYVLDTRSSEIPHVLYDDPGWDEVRAVAVRRRPIPAGRSSVVGDRTNLGQLYCLNAYLSDAAAKPDPGAPRIAKVRVFFHEGAAATADVPVEEDGSFFLEVPARTPIRLETVDARGDVLDAMRSWFWVMPNERRGCIGCHEDRELSPPNRHPLALRRLPHRVAVEANRSMSEYEQDPHGGGE